jgi:protoporphyrin/coproporphyrin ferrochelatase
MMRTGVVLMTYGSPRDLDDVGAYMTRVRGGREPSPELVAEFRRRYHTIGLSPLVEITARQAARLEATLNDDGRDAYRVRAGMRFSEPSVAGAVGALVADGAERLVGVILSPQYSPLLMAGYPQALDAAAGERGVPARTVGAWHLEPGFVRLMASRIHLALAAYPADGRERVPVLLTAHSLPKRVVEREPAYVDQLHETARAIARAAGLAPERWLFVYQSAGHTPEEWLKPDLLDVLPRLAAECHRRVLVAPVQFLADHLETLYDIDVAGRAQATQAGIEHFARIPAPNDADDLAATLAAVVRRELGAWEAEGQGEHPLPARVGPA